MKVSELLQGIEFELTGLDCSVSAIEVTGLALDSRELKRGDLFIALAGSQQHGLEHGLDVINKGAVAIIYEKCEGIEHLTHKLTDIALVAVNNLSRHVGIIASRFYGNPTEKMTVIGITGTNGKTSCSQFLGQALDSCGIIGTLGWGDWGCLNRTINTTPDAVTLQKIFSIFRTQEKTSVAMEVSSHGLDQGRVNNVMFKGAVYTNITRDHLDYHQTMELYVSAKLKLLQSPDLKFVVVNLDSNYSEKIIAEVPESVKVWGVSLKRKSLNRGEVIHLIDIQYDLDGIRLKVSWQGEIFPAKVPLYGDFNVENIACVLAVLLATGTLFNKAMKKLEGLQPVAGRMELCKGNDDLPVFIDYAHTPDALERVLASLRVHCEHALWVVFGCGGDRDKGKRYEMGLIADKLADRIIITDDNPRFEDNAEIAQQIFSGCHSDKAIIVQQRKEAIRYAIANAQVKDCIVIAGKGHEDYQEIKGTKYPFSDKQVAENALKQRLGQHQ
jgi:UDP-N-acetylmuramoyl-L-alanyl-D-glutamate--2,6-diaminopimelate ligase